MRKLILFSFLALFLWAVPAKADGVFVSGCLGNTTNASSTRYASINGGGGFSSSNSQVQITAPTDFTVTSFYAYPCITPGGGAKKYTVSVLLNGSATAFSCDLVDASVCSVTGSASWSESADDTISISANPAGTSPDVINIAWFVTYTTSITGETIVGSGAFSNLSTTTTNYTRLIGSDSSIASLEVASWEVFPMSGTLEKCKGRLSTAPGAGITRTLNFYYDSGTTAIAISWADAENGHKTDSDTVAITAGHYAVYQWTRTGTAASSAAMVACVFLPDIAGQFMLAVSDDANISVSNNTYLTINGATGTNTNTTAAYTYMRSGFTISAAYMKLSVAPNNGGGTQTYTSSLYNGASPASDTISVAISETSTTGSNSGSFSPMDGDLLHTQIAPSGTPTATRPTISYLATFGTSSGIVCSSNFLLLGVGAKC